MKKILSLILFALLILPLNGQIGRYPFYRALQTVDSSSWESEYKKVYYAIAESGRPALDTADLQNDMVKSLVDGGYWTNRIDAFYVLAQKTAAGAYINWANPGTFDITDPETTAPTFTQYTGFTGDGSSDYLSSNFNPSADKVNTSQNSVTIGIYCLTAYNTASKSVVGCLDGSGYRFDVNLSTGGKQQSAYINSGANMLLDVTNSKGFAMITRRGASETEGYRNGTSLGSDTDTSTGIPNVDMYILARNNNGTEDRFVATLLSVVLIMNAVSDEDATAINTIIETYMDAIGIGIE
jgi:hypothetical protein